MIINQFNLLRAPIIPVLIKTQHAQCVVFAVIHNKAQSFGKFD